MQNKFILIAITGVLAVAGIVGFNYDSIKNDIKSVVDNGVVEPNQNLAEKPNLKEEDMIKIMEDNGLSNIAAALEKEDYEAMDEFTNNMTDDDYINLINVKANTTAADYQKMVNMMNENGYESMAFVMGTIDLGGSCH